MASTSTSTSGDATVVSANRVWMVPGAMIAGIGGPFVLAVCNSLVNFTPGWAEAGSTAELVELAGEYPLITELVIATGLLAVLLIVPGIWAIAARLAPRTPKLAAIGGWMMASGYICSLALTTDSVTNLIVARSGLDPEAYGAAIDGQTLITQAVIFGIFGIGALGGGIILAIAMLLQRGAVPMWAGWLLLASEPVRIAGLMLGIPFGPPLASLLILAAFAGVLIAWRRTNRS